MTPRLRKPLVIVLLSTSAVLTVGCAAAALYTFPLQGPTLRCTLPLHMEMYIRWGKAYWEHTYAFDDQIDFSTWQAGRNYPSSAKARVKTVAGFGFLSKQRRQHSGRNAPHKSTESWILVMPMWFLYLLAGSPWIVFVVNRGWRKTDRSRSWSLSR
jgi:hypothetical protein